MKIVIGIDFDNTIVCYDELFHKVALEKQLIPAYLPKKKENVRDYFRQTNNEKIWTELQGYIYGPRIKEATPYRGVIDFITHSIQCGCQVYIISHKTQFPYLGPAYNLHEAARSWLDHNKFFDKNHVAFKTEHVFFETSLEAKLKRIKSLQCNYFIDDLPEILLHNDFPINIDKILFNPSQMPSQKEDKYVICNSWEEVNKFLFEKAYV